MMKTRALAIGLTTLAIGLSVATVTLRTQQPQSLPPEDSVFAQVDECDVLAAHPDDPERLADGLEDDAIVPRLARMACDRAVRRSPGEARFVFQLGRALLAAGQEADATARFRQAADRGYGAAVAY